MTMLAVGDPRRLAAGRAIRRTLACAAVFSVLTGPVKETPVLYDHAPWWAATGTSPEYRSSPCC